MRRKDKEISNEPDINAIIEKAKVCRLGMLNGSKPYIVPLCFGFHNNVLYFHSALKGLKLDLLQKNPNVCFEFDTVLETVASDEPCSFSMKYQSVIGFGKAVFIEGLDDKTKALRIITDQYSDQQFQFPGNKVKNTIVFKVEIENMTGKQS